jgi:NADPH:quinone reductase-like Zn-dependent oxidoreductase
MGQKIKAIGLKKPGSASVLQAMEIEDPALASNDIKVRIKAVSVNPSMLMNQQRFPFDHAILNSL